MQIIGLTGCARSGKDTAAEGLRQVGWVRIGFADAVRQMALAIDPLVTMAGGLRLRALVDEVGWEEAKQNPDVRRLLQNIGTEAGREVIGENVWVDIVARKIRAAELSGIPGVVITDCRFPNEIEFIKNSGGHVVRIVRPGVGPVNGHASETAADGIDADWTLDNDGTPEELQTKLIAFSL